MPAGAATYLACGSVRCDDRTVNLLLRIVVVAAATAVAAWIVPGIDVASGPVGSQIVTLLLVGAVIGAVNAFVKPIVTLVSGCLVMLTLGLFMLVINAWMLMFSGWIAGQLSLGFSVSGFWSALFGSIVISLVSALLSGMVPSRRVTA